MKLQDIASQSIGLNEVELGPDTHVKLGIDATSPHLHLGHLVPFGAFKKLIQQGCRGTVVLGDFTARIGDPSGRDKSRPVLDSCETESHAEQLREQIERFLGEGNWQFVRNSMLKPSLEQLIPILQTVSVNSMLGRDHFALRHQQGDSIALLEMLCPVLQAWDSVELECDIELGGNDQLANCTLARDIMSKFCGKRQAVMLFPILTGTDGSQKMSKSLGNHISLNDKPEDVFGKTMSIPDTLIGQWFKLLLHRDPPEGKPLQQKETLAFLLTAVLHDKKSALEAKQWFHRTFREKTVESQRTERVSSGSSVVDALVACGLASSRSDARRLIAGSGVKINGTTATQDDIISSDCLLQKGKRTAIKIQVQTVGLP